MGIMKRRKRAVELRAGVVMHADPTPEMQRFYAAQSAQTAENLEPEKPVKPVKPVKRAKRSKK